MKNINELKELAEPVKHKRREDLLSKIETEAISALSEDKDHFEVYAIKSDYEAIRTTLIQKGFNVSFIEGRIAGPRITFRLREL